jgi:ATP-binding cassette, subfamily B, bacterial MsbA
MTPAKTPIPSSRELYLRLLKYVRPYWKMLAIGLLLSAVAGLMEPILPALMQPLIDNGFAPNGSSDSLVQRAPWAVPLLIVVLFALRGVITFCAGYSMAWVQARVINDIRQEMFNHLVHLPMTYFERSPSALLITRITNDVNNIGNAATTAGVTLIRESLTMVGLLAYLLYLNPMLTVITLLVAPFIAWVTRLISTRLRNMSRASQQGLGIMTQALQESILCQKVLKIFGGEEQESRRFGKINDLMRGYAMRTAVAASAGSPLVHIFVSFAVATVVYMALLQAASGAATVGSFVSFITAMLMLLAPLRSLAGVNLTLQRGIAAAESVFGLLDEMPEAETGKLEVKRVQGHVTFESVGFRYPRGEEDALSNINLHIEAGKTLALVGASGGGKTTLVNLLPRFYPVSSGRILIDGIDTSSMSLKSLRRQIAFVSQDVMLFDDTVAANIAYGTMADADQAAIEQAAKAAYAHDFIMALPNGYQTQIGENGNRLSGGQRQRLAIARALLKDAAVLILDEATSALDSESERQVQQALEELMKNRTTLVIAHRLSTIERADTIAVMQHGRLMETGDHNTLLAKDGIYSRLYRMQYALDQAETN